MLAAPGFLPAAEEGMLWIPAELDPPEYIGAPEGVASPEWAGELPCPEFGDQPSRAFPGRPLQTCPGDQPCGSWRPAPGESWLDRPLSAGWFVGGMEGGTLAADWLEQETGFYGGFRLGWDYDPHWGCEMRLGFASLGLDDSDRACRAQAEADLARGMTQSEAAFYRLDGRKSDVRLWDVGLLWYPWAELRARPYLFIGLGAAHVDFVDRLDHRVAETVFQTPIGVGVKWRVLDWLALRFEIADNYIFGAGSGFRDLSSLSLNGGMEVRFGGPRTAYWPYNPSRHYW